MMPTMKREQFEEMSFEELLEWAYDNIDDIHSEEILKEMVKYEVEEDNFKMALHILNAIYESDCPDGSYYIYDRSMGTLETPTPITCKEDLEEYIEFDEEYNVKEMCKANEIDLYEEDEEEIEIDELYHDYSEDELREMGCFDNFNGEDY